MDQLPILVYPELSNGTKQLYLDRSAIKEIINDIQPRDFHVLDYSYNYKLSCLIIRKSGYIIKLDGIRAIVTITNIYVFQDSSNLDMEFYNHLMFQFNNQNIISKDLPFELKILEIILIFICKKSDKVLQELSNKVNEVSLENINSSKYSHVLSIQNQLLKYKLMYEEVRIIIFNLMKSEEDMCRIFISKKCEKKGDIDAEIIDELEILLETYEKQIKEDICQITKSINEIEFVLRITEINLDELRNEVAIFNSKISVFTLCTSFGGFFASIFGMNLNNTFETDKGGLYICASIIIIISSIIFLKMNKQLLMIINK